ncbi:hypothetical protein KAI46_03620 [bacterium]|nr:hypothetical protein [bacterium]
MPVWRGDDLSGRSILLWVEQGAGDAIQFVRFVPLLPGPPKKVTIYCPPNLLRLMETALGVDQVISYDQQPPVADCHLSLLSLPYKLALSTACAFACESYLQPPRDNEIDEIKVTFVEDDLRVGLVWAGNPQHVNDAGRSLAVGDFVELFEMSNVSFFSLQIFAGELDQLLIGKLPSGIIDLAPLLNDFADTARWLSKLDLLITVDTAVAHLAGALGFPAWVLLPKEADWRWALDRSESLWYPSLRLFRQSKEGEWSSVVGHVKRELFYLRQIKNYSLKGVK